MSFFRLNGWELPIREGSASRAQVVLGELARPWSNAPRPRRQAIARKWKGRAFPMEASDADTLEALLEGVGHRWAFGPDRSLFSSAGLGPEAGFDAGQVEIVATSGVSPKCPAPYAVGFAGGAGLVFDAELCPDKWTVAYWLAAGANGPWTHKIARSDLARWEDGVRNDSLLVNEILVEDGALAIFDDGGENVFADVVLLPFNASETFLEGLYRWLVADGVRSWWPLHGDGREVFDRYNASSPFLAAGASFSFAGTRGPGVLELTSATTGYIDVPHQPIAWLNGATALSFSGWGRSDGIPGPGQRVMIHVFAGTSAVAFSVAVRTTGQIQVVFEELSAAGAITLNSTDVLLDAQPSGPGLWFHVAVTIDTATDSASLWFNGKPVGIDQPGRALSTWAHTPTDLEFGRRNNGADYFWGGLDEFRLHDLPLSDAFAADAYACGLAGISDVGRPRGFSDLPKLELWGDVDKRCGESVSVVGAPAGQTYVQHGSKTGAGWRNNSREVSVEVEEVSPRLLGPSIPIRASAALLFGDRVGVNAAGARLPIVGDLPTLSTQNSYVGFPYAPFKVRSFSGAQRELSSTLEWGQIFEGSGLVSAVALVRRAGIGVIDTIFQFQGPTAAQTHFSMQFTAANEIRIGGRSTSGDGFQSIFTNGLANQTGADRWYVVGGTLDFVNGIIWGGFVRDAFSGGGGNLVGDIESVWEGEGGKTFASPRWLDSEPELSVGQNINAIEGLVGDLAYLGFFRNHRLTEAELRQFYRAFKAGVFR